MDKYRSRVRRDKDGLYVVTNGQKYRPGGINGYDHAYDMSDGGMFENQMVWARHVSQSPLARITTRDGVTVVWACEYLHQKH